MTGLLDLSHYVRRRDGTAHLELAVEGVACGGCIRKIEGSLKALPGILDARVNFANRRVAVDWRDGELDPAHVLATLDRIGYRAHPFRAERAEIEEAERAAS